MALDALAVGIERRRVNWVLDADIRGFFDAIDHDWLMKFVEHRIADMRLLRLIRKWLAAGVMEDGSWQRTDSGVPQGASISPLLANLYLHHVLDLWARSWRRTRARGLVTVVRYADDFVVGSQNHRDAVAFRSDLARRLARFRLELHPEKTRLIEFGRHAARRRRERGLGKPETFSFLGFTHMCARSRRGWFMLRRQTDRCRIRGRLRDLKAAMRRRMHRSVASQGRWLKRVLMSYYAYHAVPTNSRRLDSFRTEVMRLWLKSLRRRSQRHRMNWERFSPIAKRWLPYVRVQHPWPLQRFGRWTRGRSPVR